jgi:plasmid maintenance system antidote protein VapI
MKSREELYQTKEYWLESIQNEIFIQLEDFMQENNLNKAGLAKELGVSRAYITQILNGEFNFSLKKLIELSLAIGKVPNLHFQDMNEFINKKEEQLAQINKNENRSSLSIAMDKRTPYKKINDASKNHK